MLRSFLIGLSKLSWAQRMIMRWGVAWRAAGRFVAGEKPEDAINAIRELNSRGILATVDHLGENTLRPEDAQQATSDILLILDAIRRADVQANVSIKLSQIGLSLGNNLCRENLVRILRKAQENGNFIRLDMEESGLVDRTLVLYRQMRLEGFDNVGVVFQACLYRSQADIHSLSESLTRVRLCKGAYQEPAEVAYPKKADVDASYDRLMDSLMDQSLAAMDLMPAIDAFIPPIPAIATHDSKRIAHAQTYAERIGLGRQAFEFQMLFGIRRDLQQSLAAQGYRVRVYVPYGTRWYPYFMRRLAERPANLWFILTNFFRK
jgi:proline dehydrogenase